MIIAIIYWARPRPFIKIDNNNNMRWYTDRPALGMYDCTWQVLNNFALLDIEVERESFVLLYFETFGYLLEVKCGTWTEVQVCASDTREISLWVWSCLYFENGEARITASSPVKHKRALESMDDTLWRQEKNRTRMASMRSSETQEQTLERLEQNRTCVASMRASEKSHVKLHKYGSYIWPTHVQVQCL